MHIGKELKNIAFKTIRKEVRKIIFKHLQHLGRISDNEIKEINFIKFLEKKLPNQGIFFDCI